MKVRRHVDVILVVLRWGLRDATVKVSEDFANV